MKIIEIAAISKIYKSMNQSKTQNFAIVPYLGYKASQFLYFKKNDILVIDCSDRGVILGLVDLSELENILKKQVRIYLSSNLNCSYFISDKLGFFGPSEINLHKVSSIHGSNNSVNAVEISDFNFLDKLRIHIKKIAKVELDNSRLKKWKTLSNVSPITLNKLMSDNIDEQIFFANSKNSWNNYPSYSTSFNQALNYSKSLLQQEWYIRTLQFSYFIPQIDIGCRIVFFDKESLSFPGKVLNFELIESEDANKVDVWVAFIAFPNEEQYNPKPISSFSHLNLDPIEKNNSLSVLNWRSSVETSQLFDFWGIT